MNEKIFAYCERGGDPAFWAEPLNAVTNAAFVVAGTVVLLQMAGERSRGGGFDPVPALLAVIVLVIGAGSFLFHTLATQWASLADVIPIGIFMLLYFAFAMSRYLGLGAGSAALATAAFAGLIAVAQSVRWFGGSVGYTPALAAMFIVGIILVARRTGVARYVFAAAIVFAVSLTLRTIDQPACEMTRLFNSPTGTHFLWHLLNALTLYLLLTAARLHRHLAGENHAG